MSDLTEKEYNAAIGDEDYPVIFGVTFKTEKVVSKRGKRIDLHSKILAGENIINGENDCMKVWRYVPLTQTVYWWLSPSINEKQLTSNHLQSLQESPMRHLCIIDAATMLANHSKKSTSDRFGLPTIADWYKGHIGD